MVSSAGEGDQLLPDAGQGAAYALPDEVLSLAEGIHLALSGSVLVVKDKAFAKRHRSKICGLAVGSPPTQLHIPLYNVLWAEAIDDTLVIDYVVPGSNTQAQPARIVYPTHEKSPRALADWVEDLLGGAYGQAQRRKRAKVLVNPYAGQRGAEKIWASEVKPLFDLARMSLDVSMTSFSGDAVDMCQQLDVDAYDVVIACSGDGLAHEVFNGLGKRPDAQRALRQLAVAHIPCGSGNAMSCNIYGTHRPGPAALALIKGLRTPMDLMSVTHGHRRTLSFLSQSLGLIAESDLATENMRWIGATRFDIGVVQRIFSNKTYPCDISLKVEIDSKPAVKAHYKRQHTANHHGPRETGVGVSDDRTSTSSGGASSSGGGLPGLRYRSIKDKVPADWVTKTFDKLGSFYCGNMGFMAPKANMFPAACVNDGLMDVVMNDGNLGWPRYLDVMMSIESGDFFDKSVVSYQKVVAYRVVPHDADGYISIDGEQIPFEPFQVEVHPGLATVLTKAGRYEAPGPKGWQDEGI